MDDYKEFKHGKMDAIDGCIGHLSIAIQELGKHREFETLKNEIQMIFNEAKRIKSEVQKDE